MFAPSSGLPESWFHPDCWATVLSAKQQDYVRQVETRGIEALLAPYISARPAGSKVTAKVSESVFAPVAEPVISHVVPQARPSSIRAAFAPQQFKRPKSV